MSDEKKEYDDRDRQREKLAAWLVEWELENTLIDGEEESESPADPSVPLYDEAVEPGDVRLLIPRTGTDAAGPLYCLVLPDSNGDEMRHWIPFGRFAEPAVPEEWKTEWAETPLSVLCFWLARRLSVFASPPSWATRRLTPQQLQQVQQAWNGEREDRCGPPLLHPADPRHRYLMQERDRFDRYMQRPSGELMVSEDRGLYLTESDAGSHTWLLAAEGAAHYGVKPIMYVTEDKAVMVAAYQLANQMVRLTLMEANGFPCLRFEGGRIETERGVASGPITDAIAMATDPLYEQAAYLVDREGHRQILQSDGKDRF